MKVQDDQKRIKTESGVYISASYKTNRLEMSFVHQKSLIATFKTCFLTTQYIKDNRKYVVKVYKFLFKTRISSLKYVFIVFPETNQMLKYIHLVVEC